MRKILTLGQNNIQDEFFKQKIVITNFIALLYGLLSIPFSIFTFYFYTTLLIYPSLFQVAAFLAIFFNYKQYYQASRFVICVAFPVIYTIYSCYLLPDDHHLIASFYAIQMVFWIPPWLVFDMREKVSLFTYVLFYIVLSLSLPYLNPLFSMEADISLIREGALSWVLFVVAIFAISGGIFFLRNQTYQAEVRNEILMNQLTESHEAIQNKNFDLQQQQEEILTQNEELRQNQEEIIAQRDFIEMQNKTLHSHNKLVKFSINAALTIQKSIFKPEKDLKALFKDVFILFLPKDVVSGDFYFIEKLNRTQSIVIVADCTGHGVPGAFMSLVSNNLLEKIIIHEQVHCPKAILTQLHEEIKIKLRQKETANNSGLDAAIILIEHQADKSTKVTFAGAKRPLYYINADAPHEVKQLKGTRKSIGGIQNDNIHFENQTIFLPQDSMLYLASDGFTDQNNAERKKLGENNFVDVLRDNFSEDVHLQKENLVSLLEKHKDGAALRDDVLIVGIRV